MTNKPLTPLNWWEKLLLTTHPQTTFHPPHKRAPIISCLPTGSMTEDVRQADSWTMKSKFHHLGGDCDFNHVCLI